MKRLFITSLILALFTFALVGCGSTNETTNIAGGDKQSSDQLKEMDTLMDSVRTDQYADNTLDTL